MAGRRRALREDVERLLAFGLAARTQLVAKKGLGTEIVASALEHRRILGKLARIRAIDAPSGEDPRQRHHILLAVTTISTERVQLHDLACEILVEPDLTIPPAWARG